MFKLLHYEDIDKGLIDNYVLIDLRSPGEYNSETIPGAINIPVFTDEERKEIGTIYVNDSVDKAKYLGVEYVSKRLPEMYKKISLLDKQYSNLIFFCARGGLRSTSLVSLLKSLGINAIKLDGGYKSYRKYVHTYLPVLVNQVKFLVLYGNTGSGKTDILKALSKQGMDVLDLEGAANHRGSLLGSIGMGKQNSQKMFESLIFHTLRSRKSDLVFVEGESKRIGKCVQPDYLYAAIKEGINIKINADIEFRIDNIVKDYVHDNDDELISSLNFLRKNIGNKIVDKEIELIHKHNYRQVIEELMVKYYDPMYEHRKREYEFVFENRDSEETAREIIRAIDSSQIDPSLRSRMTPAEI